MSEIDALAIETSNLSVSDDDRKGRDKAANARAKARFKCSKHMKRQEYAARRKHNREQIVRLQRWVVEEVTARHQLSKELQERKDVAKELEALKSQLMCFVEDQAKSLRSIYRRINRQPDTDGVDLEQSHLMLTGIPTQTPDEYPPETRSSFQLDQRMDEDADNEEEEELD